MNAWDAFWNPATIYGKIAATLAVVFVAAVSGANYILEGFEVFQWVFAALGSFSGVVLLLLVWWPRSKADEDSHRGRQTEDQAVNRE